MLTSPVESTPLQITDPQQGLLVADAQAPAREIYNQITHVDIDPGRSVDEVVTALAALVTVQPALRQVFGFLPRPHARLAPPPRREDIPLERVEVPAAEYSQAAGAMAELLGRSPFDLASGPAFRFGYLRATDGSAAAIVVCLHLIVCDGDSIRPIHRDLASVLAHGRTAVEAEALRAEREAAFLAELTAQNEASGSDQTATYAQAWADQLRETPPLVLDPHPGRPARAGYSAARVSWQFSEADTIGFAAACQRLAVSPFVLLCAVYGTVLARHAGVPSVLVCSPFTARQTTVSLDLCGFFTHTLPVAVDVDWSRTVDEHVGTTVAEAVDHCRLHANVTLGQLVSRTGQDGVNIRDPLFSALLAVRDIFDGESARATTGGPAPGSDMTTLDLWLEMTPADGRWLLELGYGRHPHAAAVADGLLDSLRMALRRALADGSRTLADLFTDAPSAPAPAAAGGLTQEPPSSLADWIDATARRQPDAVAVEEPLRTLTYGELVAAAEQTAAGLARRGVRAGDIVGLALDGLRDSVVAILAILRCGATYLPLDTSLPKERLGRMVAEAGCQLIIGHDTGLPAAATADLGHGDPQSAVYLMFTSGSTGLPKGVVMGHGPLLNLAAWQISALNHDAETRFLQYSPLGFDVSFQEIMPTLASGGTVVSREPVDRRDFPALVRRVTETRITHAFLPVAALRPFVQAALGTQARFPDLRWVCVSGEQLLADDEIRRFFIDHPHCTLVNLYGPTETNAATAHLLSASEPNWPTHVPIGRPLPGVAAYVVDVTGHLAPTGVPGELYLGGVCPAEGYLDDERAAESFLPDRFSGIGGARMYRTGDQVVRGADGTLVFLGRRDAQTKIHGYRVELGEIEAVANASDGVHRAVAVPLGAAADRELALFLFAGDGARADHAEIRARLVAALPPYMVPAWTFDTDAIPTSRTGKTDRDALIAQADQLILEQQADPGAKPPVDYADELERGLADIWVAVLDTERIARDRSLLEYGAHSLNMLTAFAQIQDQYGAQIPVPSFFRSPTITALAGLVRASQEDAEAGK